jgi:hypothetical protein
VAGRPLIQRPWAVAQFMANNQRHRPAPVEAHCEVAQQLAQHLLLGRGIVETARSEGARPLTVSVANHPGKGLVLVVERALRWQPPK